MDAYEYITKDRCGSFELKRYLPRYLWIGLAVSVLLHLTLIGSYLLAQALKRVPPSPKRIVVLDASKLGAPPSITDRTVPPSIKVAQPRIAPPAAAKPVAVPDEEEKEEVTIQSQEELAISATPAEDTTLYGGEGVQVVIEELEAEDADDIPETFTAFEVPPQPIVNPRPAYPEAAKMVQVEAVVAVKVYVDEKGNVRRWEILKADPPGLGFEAEVIKVLPQWKFTPAIQQNKPVGVWIILPFHFEFSQ